MLLSRYEREVLANAAVIDTSSKPYANIWVGKAEWISDVFLISSSCCSHHSTVFLWTRTQSGNIHCSTTWLSGLNHLLACGVALIDRPLELIQIIIMIRRMIIITNIVKYYTISEYWNIYPPPGHILFWRYWHILPSRTYFGLRVLKHFEKKIYKDLEQ